MDVGLSDILRKFDLIVYENATCSLSSEQFVTNKFSDCSAEAEAEVMLRLTVSLAASVVYWSESLTTDPEVRVRFPELRAFLRGSGSGTGSTQPREYN
jgi:hypothetical protein